MDAMKLMTEGMIKENRPAFNVGDTVRVSVRIKEGERVTAAFRRRLPCAVLLTELA